MEIQEIAKVLVKRDNLYQAEKYDFADRGDGEIELIGYVPDPTLDIRDFDRREMLFPKRWLTLGVLPASTQVKL